MKMKKRKEEIEKFLLGNFLKDELPKPEYPNLSNSKSQHNFKTVYKLKSPFVINKENETTKNTLKSKHATFTTKFKTNKVEEPKKEALDMKGFHNFVDDIQLNFHNTVNDETDRVKLNTRSLYGSTSPIKIRVNNNVEEAPIVDQQQILKNMMSATLYPGSLSRSFEFDMFKKYIGRLKQEKFKEEIRNHVMPHNSISIKTESLPKNTQKKKKNIINVASKLPSFTLGLNKELGRVSSYYGKETSLGRFDIDDKLNLIFDEQENVLGYRNKKINIKHDRKIKLKPLIVKNRSSV